MAIASNEIKLYKSLTINESGTNGGRLSALAYTSNALNNIFPAVSTDERTAGVIRHRKAHLKIDNAANTVASKVLIMLADISSASGVRNTLFEGTQRNTQANITGSERKYGVGRLSANKSIGDTVMTAVFETGSAADNVIQSGDKVYITDGVNSEKNVIQSVAAWSGENRQITLTTPLSNNFDATVTTISPYIEKISLQPTVDSWVETSAAGTYNEGTYPVAVGNLATIEQTWTLTFTSSTNFSVIGDTVGSVGSGTIAGNFSPINGAFSLPYFSLLAAGFGGAWATNDTIVFQTHPNSIPLWIKQVVTAGAASAIDTSIIRIKVES